MRPEITLPVLQLCDQTAHFLCKGENALTILTPNIMPQVENIKVSIIITHFNYSDFIVHALTSVIAQDHAHWECIVVDDFSTELHRQKVAEIIKSLADDRINLLQLPKNEGQTHAVFAGLALSTGEFVSLLDSDDLYESTFLSKMLKCHLNPRVYAAVAACEMGLFRVGGSMLTRSYVGFKDRAIQAGDLPKFEACLLDFGFSTYYAPETVGWLWGTTSSLMFRRDALQILRRETYMPDMKICADTYCVYGAHMLGGTLFLDETLSWRGLHEDNAAESTLLFSSRQNRHRASFVDLSEAIKLFAARTILENNGITNLKPAHAIATFTAHFTSDQLKNFITEHKSLSEVLAKAFTDQTAQALPNPDVKQNKSLVRPTGVEPVFTT